MLIRCGTSKEKHGVCIWCFSAVRREPAAALFVRQPVDVVCIDYSLSLFFDRFWQSAFFCAVGTEGIDGIKDIHVPDAFAVDIACTAGSAGIKKVFQSVSVRYGSVQNFLCIIEQPLSGAGVKTVALINWTDFCKIPTVHFVRKDPLALSAVIAGIHGISKIR